MDDSSGQKRDPEPEHEQNGQQGTAHKPHQLRAAALLRAALACGETLEGELSVPAVSRRIDMFVVVKKASSLWGPLRGTLDRRPVVIEHFSQPPSAGAITSGLIKSAWAQERWLAGKWPKTRRPLLLLISVGRPLEALRFLAPALSEEDLPGLHCAGGLLEVMLVNVRRLPKRDDTAFLRLFDHDRRRRVGNLQQLFHSDAVGILEKERVKETVMKNRAVFDKSEFHISYQGAVQLGEQTGEKRGLLEGKKIGLLEGKKIGLREGEQRGLLEGEQRGLREGEKRGLREGEKRGLREGEQRGQRKAILALAKAQLDKAALAELRAITDLDELTKRYLALLPAQLRVK